MENKIYIASRNVNLEIIAKLLNSVAKKYECHVRYNQRENSLRFIGEENYWRHIMEELIEFFFPNPSKEPVPVGHPKSCSSQIS